MGRMQRRRSSKTALHFHCNQKNKKAQNAADRASATWNVRGADWLVKPYPCLNCLISSRTRLTNASWVIDMRQPYKDPMKPLKISR